MEFKNEGVAAKYNCLTDKDRKIHIAGTYSGLLSNMDEKTADRMVKSKSNLIALKDGIAANTEAIVPDAGSATEEIKPDAGSKGSDENVGDGKTKKNKKETEPQ